MRLLGAVLALVVLSGFKPPASNRLCGAYTCWHLIGGNKDGYACMNIPGGAAINTCEATISGCTRGPCTRQFVTGPGGRVLAVLEPNCLRRRPFAARPARTA
jgi:hypothetical protein